MALNPQEIKCRHAKVSTERESQQVKDPQNLGRTKMLHGESLFGGRDSHQCKNIVVKSESSRRQFETMSPCPEPSKTRSLKAL